MLSTLFGLSIIARLPLPMLSIGLLVHAERLTGSFAAAGVVTAVFAAALGVGGTLLGRVVDRRGHTPVLLPAALIAGAALAATAALPAGASVASLIALAAVLGLTVPPVGACLRTLLPGLVGKGDVDAAYATEATAVELTFVAGPPLVLLAGAAWSTGAALAAAAALLVAATVAFAAHPASRTWRPAPVSSRPRGGSLHSGGMRTLVLALVAVGVAFGAVEVSVAAAAEALGRTAAAGPLLGVWGAGSLIGGVVAARSGRGAGLALWLAALAVGHLALAAATGSVIALAAVLTLAGATISPTYACVYAMVEDVAPAGTITEAFAWLGTAVAIGASVGAALAGTLADAAGPASTFLLAGAAGGIAAVVTLLRTHTLSGPSVVACEPAG
jgi:MFS family permease